MGTHLGTWCLPVVVLLLLPLLVSSHFTVRRFRQWKSGFEGEICFKTNVQLCGFKALIRFSRPVTGLNAYNFDLKHPKARTRKVMGRSRASYQNFAVGENICLKFQGKKVRHERIKVRQFFVAKTKKHCPGKKGRKKTKTMRRTGREHMTKTQKLRATRKPVTELIPTTTRKSAKSTFVSRATRKSAKGTLAPRTAENAMKKTQETTSLAQPTLTPCAGNDSRTSKLKGTDSPRKPGTALKTPGPTAPTSKDFKLSSTGTRVTGRPMRNTSGTRATIRPRKETTTSRNIKRPIKKTPRPRATRRLIKTTSRPRSTRRHRKKTSRPRTTKRPMKKTPRPKPTKRLRNKTPRPTAIKSLRKTTPRPRTTRRHRKKTSRPRTTKRPMKKTPRPKPTKRLNNKTPRPTAIKRLRKTTPRPRTTRRLRKKTPRPRTTKRPRKKTPRPKPTKRLNNKTPRPTAIKRLRKTTPRPRTTRRLRKKTPRPRTTKRPRKKTPRPKPTKRLNKTPRPTAIKRLRKTTPRPRTTRRLRKKTPRPRTTKRPRKKTPRPKPTKRLNNKTPRPTAIKRLRKTTPRPRTTRRLRKKTPRPRTTKRPRKKTPRPKPTKRLNNKTPRPTAIKRLRKTTPRPRTTRRLRKKTPRPRTTKRPRKKTPRPKPTKRLNNKTPRPTAIKRLRKTTPRPRTTRRLRKKTPRPRTTKRPRKKTPRPKPTKRLNKTPRPTATKRLRKTTPRPRTTRRLRKKTPRPRTTKRPKKKTPKPKSTKIPLKKTPRQMTTRRFRKTTPGQRSTMNKSPKSQVTSRRMKTTPRPRSTKRPKKTPRPRTTRRPLKKTIRPKPTRRPVKQTRRPKTTRRPMKKSPRPYTTTSMTKTHTDTNHPMMKGLRSRTTTKAGRASKEPCADTTKPTKPANEKRVGSTHGPVNAISNKLQGTKVPNGGKKTKTQATTRTLPNRQRPTQTPRSTRFRERLHGRTQLKRGGLGSTTPAASLTTAVSRSTRKPQTNMPRQAGTGLPCEERTTGGGFSLSEVLDKSILFYEAQRSGRLPADNRVSWRHDSTENDGQDNGVDLEGGWFDSGDYVKFNFPMAWSTTVLAWGLGKFKAGYQAAGQLLNMYDSIRWPLDYFLKCWDEKNQIYWAQVGDPLGNHGEWTRAEDLNITRPSFAVTKRNPGSDVAGETVAALAAASIAFKDEDEEYCDKLLANAISLFDFAHTYRGKYSSSLVKVTDTYISKNGYEDELCWAAAWLYKATNDVKYRTIAMRYLSKIVQEEFSWDDKNIGCQLLMFSAGALSKETIEGFMAKWLLKAQTSCGLAYHCESGPLRYSANAALIALLAAEEGIKPSLYRMWALSQLDYIFGANEAHRSYVVGFGNNPPVRALHRGSSCPKNQSQACSWEDRDKSAPNPNVLYGALVSGPDKYGDFQDVRSDTTRVACDYNAGFQSAVAGVLDLRTRNIYVPHINVC